MEESNKYFEVKAVKISVGRKRLAKLFGFSLLPAFYFLLSVSSAQAATLFLSPETGSFDVGQTFSVSVFVSSPNQAMNAAEGVISFPADKLQVVSLSKNASIFNLWVREPSFSNAVGTLSFEGIVLNPGFAGSVGKLLTVTFRAEDAGSASVNFSSGSVLANDGMGTNIFSGFSGADYLLGAGQTYPSQEEIQQGQLPQEETSPAKGVPVAPRISSPTHPESDKWYSEKNAKFLWPLPSGITGTRVLFGRFSRSTPTVAYAPAIDSKEVGPLNNGIWYFHVQLRNRNGWGDVSHIRFQIDTEKPDRFEVQEIERTDPTEPRIKLALNAHDRISGIDHYEVQIDGGNPEIWKDDEDHVYETPALDPGKHILVLKAVDKAGNFLEQSRGATVDPLNPPVLTEYPAKIKSGELLTIRGTTYPDSQVTLWLQREGDVSGQYTVSSNGEGHFIFETQDKLKAGQYKAWAQVMDKKGAKSNPGDKVSITIEKKLAVLQQLSIHVNFSKLLRIGSDAADFLAVLVQIIALIVLLIVILQYGLSRFGLFRREVDDLKKSKRKLFSSLNAFRDVRKQTITLERVKSRSGLTEEDRKVIGELEKTLDKADNLVMKIKEIEDKAKTQESSQ